jgi:predicted cation transporter
MGGVGAVDVAGDAASIAAKLPSPRKATARMVHLLLWAVTIGATLTDIGNASKVRFRIH